MPLPLEIGCTSGELAAVKIGERKKEKKLNHYNGYDILRDAGEVKSGAKNNAKKSQE